MQTMFFSEDSPPAESTVTERGFFDKFSEEFLDSMMYLPRCANGRSLKKITLRDINPDTLLYYDLAQYSNLLAFLDLSQCAPCRVKSASSCQLKILKYGTSYPLQKILNDILSFRVVVEEFPRLTNIPEYFKIADLTQSKSVDDGYRGLHLYYLGDNRTLPIEIQIWQSADYVLNKFLHDKVYKQYPASVGYAVVNAVAGIPREDFSSEMLDEILYGVLNKSI